MTSLVRVTYDILAAVAADREGKDLLDSAERDGLARVHNVSIAERHGWIGANADLSAECGVLKAHDGAGITGERGAVAQTDNDPTAEREALARAGNPLISIILLCYNQAAFVAEAVEGVLSQTYSPLEIIIFDDCSTDQTAEIIGHTLAKCSRQRNIRFIRTANNMGGFAVAEMGLGMAKGDFMFISSGDDVMLPEMVKEMTTVWTTEGVSLVTANAYYIDEHSRSLNRTFRDPTQPGDDSFETLARDGGNACCFGAAIGFERDLFTTFGLPPAYLSCYDIMYPFYAYLLKGARFVAKPLLKYRVHSQNSSLSLQHESSSGIDRLLVEEEIHFRHLAHAFLMEAELDRLNDADPSRYSEIVRAIKPLVAVQAIERARKLTRTRIALSERGICRLAARG
jgi:Glycosyl transferase family 2